MANFKTIIEFIVEISHDQPYRSYFYTIINNPQVTYDDIYKFFTDIKNHPSPFNDEKKYKYTVSPEECIRILENKDRILHETNTKNY